MSSRLVKAPSPKRVPQSSTNAPAVVFFFYRRPETTRRVFESIRHAKPRVLYLVSDGPKSDSPEDVFFVDECRRITSKIDWPCDVTRIFAEANMGLRERVLSGLDIVFSNEESAIILEDDCLPSPAFFDYAAELLDRFNAHPTVALVSASKFHRGRTSDYSYDFSHDALIWGWGTWASVWHRFRSSLGHLEKGLTPSEQALLAQSFSSRPKKAGFLREIKSLYSSGLDSWAMYFAIFVRINGLLAVIPEKNLVRNIGFGRDSTHTKFEAFDMDIAQEALEFPLRHPGRVICNREIEQKETKTRIWKWIAFPIVHPVDFLFRLFRYISISRTSSPGGHSRELVS